MPTRSRKTGVFDHVLGFIERFYETNASKIHAQDEQIRLALFKPILDGLGQAKTPSSQFDLIHASVGEGAKLFKNNADGISKETLMSIVRRAPSCYLQGADLVLATMIVKYAAPEPDRSFDVQTGRTFQLWALGSVADLSAAFRLIAIANTINDLLNCARRVGKGGTIVKRGCDNFEIEMPPDVEVAIEAYERRRPKRSPFDSKGFFAPLSGPKGSAQYLVPTLIGLEHGRYFEAPKGSDRWLYFERLPSMFDGGGLARLLRGYDEPIKETWGVGADHILHFLTSLAVLIHDTSPAVLEFNEEGAFAPSAPTADFEHRIRFTFDLARKGFLRLPRAHVIKNIGRVRTNVAPSNDIGERLAAEFIDAFLFVPSMAGLLDPLTAKHTPFIHATTNDFIYIDLLLLWDFLANVLEAGKEWYSSQHGDRFVLDLKRWFDNESPGSVVQARRAVQLAEGGISDIDLLINGPDGLLVVECKAFGKSADFMIGAPDAVTARRKGIRRAVHQADRIADAFSKSVRLGNTEFPSSTCVRAIVCTPSVEFLKPLEEHGMLSDRLPRVVTPEELLGFVIGI